MATVKKPFHEIVAENLIKQLEAGTAPWQRPWNPGEASTFLPYNPATDNRYKGINALVLLSQNRDDQRWMTYKQATDAGAQVRKGEKGTGIQYWKFVDEHNKKDDEGKPLVDKQGKPLKETVKLERPRVFFATVFNAEQIEGLPPIQRQAQTWNPLERAEAILAVSGVPIHYNGKGRAFYRPLTDSIHLPDRELFPSADKFYATALHELGHSTGHRDRLNRDLSHPFGSEGYAKEELRAEIASMILGDELGIGHDSNQHAAYVGSWIKALKEDPLEIFRAAADAEKIQAYVLGLEQQQVQEQVQEKVQIQAQEHKTQQPSQELPSSEVIVMATTQVQAQTQAYTPDQFIISIVEDIERAKAGLAEWHNVDAQRRGEGAAVLASERVQQGQYDEALAYLQTVAALESNYSTQEHFNALTKTLEQGWRAWQQENGVGPAITPAMKQSLEALPIELSQLSNATPDDYRKAAELARLREEHVKRDPASTAEDIAAAREQRKTADLAVTIHDSDFQKKVTEIEQQQAQKKRQSGKTTSKTTINVPFREKNTAKALGAAWDRGLQSWYIPEGVDPAPFDQWKQKDDTNSKSAAEITHRKVPSDEVSVDRQYLAVPFKERVMAKAAGARWDQSAKSWYAGPLADMNALQQWLPENVQSQQAPALMPREEFSEAMRTVGCILTGDHPIMDSRKHRIATVGDKAGKRAGFYVGFLDGHPAGYVQNNRTGEVVKWKAKGYELSEVEKAALQADQAAKLQQRVAAQKAQQDVVASAVRQLLAIALPALAEHGYLKAKQVRPYDLRVVPLDGSNLPADSIVMIGKTWQASKALSELNPDKLVFTAGDLLLTAQSVSGEIRSVQAIQENGLKRFAAGGVKQAMFHVVGGQGLEALNKAPSIVITEGYATADTVSQALGYATVAAFDSGNLLNVAQQLREKFPHKPFIIAGDNDVHLELTEGKNPGKEKALAAAKAVDGTAIFPIFAPDEQSYPDNLEPITPLTGRTRELTDEQQAAITKMKQYTDFNDLVTNSLLGREGLERQVMTRVYNIIESQKEQLLVNRRQEQKSFEKCDQHQQRNAMKI
jgi:putative DNA primase/helicase